MKNQKKKSAFYNIRRGLALFLAVLIVITGIDIGSVKSLAAPGGSEAEAYKCTNGDGSINTSVVSSLTSSGLTLGNGTPFDPSKSYEAGTVFQTVLDFTIDQALIAAINADGTIADDDVIFFEYSLPSNVNTASAMGTNGAILGSADNGTYEIGDGKVYFKIKKQYFVNHTSGVGVQFEYSFEADSSKVDDGGKTEIEFAGTGVTVPIKMEVPGATGWKTNGSTITGTNGKTYIPYTISLYTNSRESKDCTITDTPGSNMSIDLLDTNTNLVVKYNGSVLDPSQYIAVPDGDGFKIQITDTSLGANIGAKSSIEVSYNALLKDATLDSNGDGKVDGTENSATWKIDGNSPLSPVYATPKIDVEGAFKMDKVSNVNGATATWTVLLNTATMPIDMGGFTYTDTLAAPSEVDLKYSLVEIKNAAGVVVATIPASQLEANNGNFSYTFPADAGAQKYTITYTTEVISPMGNGESVELKNTGTVKDGTTTKGTDTETAKISKDEKIGISKKYVGEFQADYTQAWETTVVPDENDGLTNGTIYDRLSSGDNSWDTYYGSVFVEDSIVVKVDGATLVNGVDYTLTFSKSDSATTAGAPGNDIFEIKFINGVKYTASQPITISYVSQDDGSNLDAGKNLNNYTHVQTVKGKYPATAYTYVTTSSIKRSMYKSGKFAADAKSIGWEIWTNSQNTWDREGIYDFTGKNITIEDILPEGTEYIDGSTTIKLYYDGGDYDGYAVTGFGVNYDKDTRKLTLSVPYSVVVAASAGVKGKFILCTNYRSTVNTYKSIKNAASYSANGKKVDETYAIVKNPEGDLLNKAGSIAADKQSILYTVDVNPSAYDYVKDSDVLNLKDELPAGTINSGSIAIVDSMGNNLLEQGKASYTYKALDNQLLFTIPDGTHVIISYKLTPDLSGFSKNPDGSYDVKNLYNTIKCTSTVDGESSTKGITGSMTSSAATMKGRTLSINKVDASDMDKKLGGASFKLKKFDTALSTFVDVVTADAITVDKNTYSTATADDFVTATGTGIITYANLQYDTIYSFQESKAPVGYDLDTTVRYIILIHDSGASTTALSAFAAATGIDIAKVKNIADDNNVLFTDTSNGKTLTDIRKVDSEGNTLSGATLAVYSTEAGTAMDYDAQLDGDYYKRKDMVGTSWTSGSVEHSIEALNADEIYILHELSAPAGYKIAADVAFKVEKAGNTTKVSMIDEKTKLDVEKKEINTSTHIVGGYVLGATLKIVDESTGTVVDSWVTTGAVHSVEGKLVAGKTYVLKETDVPTGYKVADDIRFKVSDDGKSYINLADSTPITSILMLDPISTTVKVAKKDSAGNLIKGAKLQILDNSGVVVPLPEVYDAGKDYWTSDGTEKVITGLPTLPLGQNYKLHELEAPEGYVLAADKVFTLNDTDRTVDLTMTDALAKSFTLKVNKTDGVAPLAGARLQLLDSEKNVIMLGIYDAGKNYWTSDGINTMSITDLKSGIYYIRELSAPTGYSAVGADIKVEFKESDIVLQKTVDVVNTKISAKLTLNKLTDTNEALPGATFKIYEAVLDSSGKPKKTGSVYDKVLPEIWTATGATWSVTSADANLVVGKTYIIEETVVPTTDPLGNPVTYKGSDEVAIKLEAGDNKVNIQNTLLAAPEYPMGVAKVDIDGNSVAGAKLEIYSAVLSGSTYVKGTVQTVNIDAKTNPGVTNWLSASRVSLIYGLTTGDYYLHEAAVPAGSNFKLATDILFHYDSTTGKVTTYKGVTKAVTLTKDATEIDMVDDYKPFHVEKRVTGETTIVTGAVLTIYKQGDLVTPIKVLDNTNGDGQWYVDTTDLTPGKYVLRETTTPLGYSKSADIDFTVNSDNTVSYTYKGISYTKVHSIFMEDSKLNLKVNKTDGNGMPLAGAKLQILDNTKTLITGLSIYDMGQNYWTTGSTGSVVLTDLPAGHYYLHEFSAPAGYDTSTDIDFTLNEDGTVSYVYGGKSYIKVSAINMVDEKLSLSVLKTDMSNHMLSGAILDIYASVPGTTYKVKDTAGTTVNVDISGPSLQTISTLGTDSVDITATLTSGNYYLLVETTAPDGYYVADPIYFYYDGTCTYYLGSTKYEHVKQLTMKDVPTELGIKKLDENNNKALPGATFEIYEDTYVAGVSHHATTGAPVKTFVSGTTSEIIRALVVNKWYILKETKAPAGYALADLIAFKLESDGNVTYGTVNDLSATDELDNRVTGASIAVSDKKTEIKIDKKADGLGGASITGATLVIKKGATVVQTIKPTGGPVTVTGLAMDTEYTISETVVPVGYTKSADIKFVIDSATGSVKITSEYTDSLGTVIYAAGTTISLSSAIVMVDNSVAKLAIKKTNAAGVGLPGAEFDIYKAIDSGLPATGDAPASGFKSYSNTTADEPYTVDYVAKEEGGNWWMVDSSVVAGTDGTSFTSDGSEIAFDSITNTWLAAGKYILVEKVAPEGYMRVEPQLINVAPAPSSDTIKVADKVKPNLEPYVRINKVDDHNVAVKGAKLELYNVDSTGKISGAPIDTWITDGTARVIRTLKVGNYYILREVSAPTGYLKAQDVLFQVETAELPTEVVMIDKRDTTVVNLEISKTVAGEPLAGAKFELMSKDDVVDFTKSTISVTGPGTYLRIKKSSISWVGGLEPEVFGNLPNATYILYERVAPEGCEDAVAGANVTFTVEQGKIVSSSKTDIFGYTATYSEDGNKNVIVVDNKGKKNLVKLSKMTNGFTLIPGAKMQLTCTDPSVDMQYVICLSGGTDFVHTATDCKWTTTESKIVLSNLEDKEYILTELEAPAGYLEAEPIHFTTEGGNIKTINGVPVDQYNCEMVDLVDPGEVTATFFKTDADDHIKFLSGAVFELYGDKACTELLGTAVSNEYGMVSFPNITRLGRLYLKETAAPTGYTLSDRIYVINIYKTYEGRSVAYEDGFEGTTSSGYAIITNKSNSTNTPPSPDPEDDNKLIPGVPKPPVTDTNREGGAPQTGDNSHPMMWLLLMLAGIATTASSAAALRFRKKE